MSIARPYNISPVLSESQIQLCTIAELFAGQKPQIPFLDPSTFRKARQEETRQQARLF